MMDHRTKGVRETANSIKEKISKSRSTGANLQRYATRQSLLPVMSSAGGPEQVGNATNGLNKKQCNDFSFKIILFYNFFLCNCASAYP